MKAFVKIVLVSVFVQFIVYSQADARGEIPPPPPFTGGDAGDWLGSGPIFGFEGDNGGTGPGGLRRPWNGGGGSNGGWGGSWWNGDGPLGGGGWGGWGGWGSGLHGEGGPPDSTKKGHIWPDAPVAGSCIKMSETGARSICACRYQRTADMKPGQPVVGTCQRSGRQGADPTRYCDKAGKTCESTVD